MMIFLGSDILLRVGFLTLAQGEHAIATLPPKMDIEPLLVEVMGRGPFHVLDQLGNGNVRRDGSHEMHMIGPPLIA